MIETSHPFEKTAHVSERFGKMIGRKHMRTHDYTGFVRGKVGAHAVGNFFEDVLVENAVVVAVAAPGHNRNQQKKGATAFIDYGFGAVFCNGKQLFVAVAAGLLSFEVGKRSFDVSVFALGEHGIAQLPQASFIGQRLQMRCALRKNAHDADKFVADIVETDFGAHDQDKGWK